jgi:hypothetical protein
MRAAAVVAACLWPLVAFAGPKPRPTRGPVKVFVAAKPAPAPLSLAQLKAKQDEADTLVRRFEELEKGYQKQFGKKREKWPAETQAAYFEALDARNTAVTDLWYAAPSEKTKTDSAEDVWKALGGGKEAPEPEDFWIALVANRKEADIVVEILGRYGQTKMLRGDKYIGFEIVPGRIGSKVLAQVPRGWTRKGSWMNLITDHWLTPREPFFRFEVSDTERWRDVAARVAAAMTLFVKENYDRLKPAK